MNFVPVLPGGGYQGWTFLSRTMDAQRAAFAADRSVARAAETFEARIANVRTAAELVADRPLLEVALTAFGLEEDIGAKAFIEKVLAEGTLRDDAFANRLADKRYAALARAFGFGDLGARTGLPGFAEDITARYEARQFEAAVGTVDDKLRRALHFGAGLTDILGQVQSTDARWFALMGDLPLRSVMEGALGLPSSLGKLNLDQQLDNFTTRFARVFGTDDLAVLEDPAARERLIRLYLVRTEAAMNDVGGSAAIALQLLSAGG